MVTPDRGRAQGRAARGPELDRLRPRERDRLPHLHGDGARPVRGAVLQLPARTNAEGPTRRAPYLAEGRVPGLTPPLRSATNETTACLLQSPLTDSNRRPPPYMDIREST